MGIIKVENLTKDFSFQIKKKGKGLLSYLLKPEMKTIRAVNSINLEIEKGETVAFIGPNGAGKSTTIKMLTGILFPTSGKIEVVGLNPQEQREELAYKIGVVFGQRSQLIFNLPLYDSFGLFARIYGLDDAVAKSRQKELFEIFGLDEFVNNPVRKLSLGQRMRAEIALALQHNPEIVFLDEPTIGLDIVAKNSLRETLVRLNKTLGTTIFLTSHDVSDIEAVCDRTIIINHGNIVLDELTDVIQKKYFTYKVIRIELEDSTQEIKVDGAKLVSKKDEYVVLQIDTSKHSLNKIIKTILGEYQVNDIDVENPELEQIISHIYQSSGR